MLHKKNGLKEHCQLCDSKEFVFYSRERLALYHCGHAVHWKCYQKSFGVPCKICANNDQDVDEEDDE